MPLGYDSHLPHRRSIRLRGYDYTRDGVYFITICTHGKDCVFGEIADGEMRLREWGRVVQIEWRRTATVRPNASLGAFVVMPDHIHGLLVLARAEPKPAPESPRPRTGDPSGRPATAPVLQPTGPAAGSLGAIIGQYKSAVTKRIRTLSDAQAGPLWQRGYHDHIVRGDEALQRIREYVETNPKRWELDSRHPGNG